MAKKPGSLITIVDEDGGFVEFGKTAAADWTAVEVNEIEESGVYQVLFDAEHAMRGGYIINTSDPGTGPLWIDVTGALGNIRSTAAFPVYAAFDPTSAPGTWRFPATTGAVTIMGPAGATFQAFAA